MKIEIAQLEWLLSVLSVLLETERDVGEVMEDMELMEKGVAQKVREVRQELEERLGRGVEEM